MIFKKLRHKSKKATGGWSDRSWGDYKPANEAIHLQVYGIQIRRLVQEKSKTTHFVSPSAPGLLRKIFSAISTRFLSRGDKYVLFWIRNSMQVRSGKRENSFITS